MYLEAQIAQRSRRTMHATAEVMRTEWCAGRVPVGRTQDRLGVVCLAVDDQQIRPGSPESVARQEFLLTKFVVLDSGLPAWRG